MRVTLWCGRTNRKACRYLIGQVINNSSFPLSLFTYFLFPIELKDFFLQPPGSPLLNGYPHFWGFFWVVKAIGHWSESRILRYTHMRESTGALTFFFFLRKPSTFPLHPTRVVWIDKIVRNLLLSFIKVRIYRLVPRVCGFTTSPRVHLCAPAAAVTSSLFGYASHFLKGQSRCFPLIYWPFLANLSPPPVPLSFYNTAMEWKERYATCIYFLFLYGYKKMHAELVVCLFLPSRPFAPLH